MSHSSTQSVRENKTRLLIVEDDAELRAALRRSAEKLCNNIDEASSALEAILIIRKCTPSLIISDWDLGGQLSGVDVANYIAQHAPSTKLVLITGKSMQHLKTKTNHLSINYYMAKPFSVAEFRSVLKQFID